MRRSSPKSAVNSIVQQINSPFEFLFSSSRFSSSTGASRYSVITKYFLPVLQVSCFSANKAPTSRCAGVSLQTSYINLSCLFVDFILRRYFSGSPRTTKASSRPSFPCLTHNENLHFQLDVPPAKSQNFPSPQPRDRSQLEAGVVPYVFSGAASESRCRSSGLFGYPASMYFRDPEGNLIEARYYWVVRY